MPTLRFGLVVVLALTSASWAQEVERSLAEWAALEGDLERLECYDTLARTHGLSPQPAQQVAIQGTGKWQVQTKVNPIDDTKTVIVWLDADSGISRWEEPVRLLLRCQSNETDLIIQWHDYLGSEAKVLTRMGKNSAVTATWSLSTDSQSTFYPRDPLTYIRALMRESSFVAQITPYNENPVTAVFDTAGLRNAIRPLAETCGWKLDAP